MFNLICKLSPYAVVDFSKAFDKCCLVLMSRLTISQYSLYCVHHVQHNET